VVFTARAGGHNRVTDVSQILERFGAISPVSRWFLALV